MNAPTAYPPLAYPVIDSHCHLDFAVLRDDLDGVIKRARAAGVRLMTTIGTRIAHMPQVIDIIDRYDEVYGSVGVHPHNVAEEKGLTTRALAKWARHPKIIGIGESGLDYHYDRSPRDIQASVFRVHIEVARRLGLPLIVHSRDADDDTAAILEQEYAQGTFTPLLHCFSAGAALAERVLAIGGYVSFSGIVTFRSAAEIKEVARAVPEDRLLVETDSPYLAPTPMRGKPNEPAYTRYTLAYLAELRGVDVNCLARRTSDNFFRLFTKAVRPAEYR